MQLCHKKSNSYKMPFQVFQDESSSSSVENSSRNTISTPQPTLRQPPNQSTVQEKVAIPEVKAEKKFNNQNKTQKGGKDSDKAKIDGFRRLVEQDTPIPQNKENYDYLRKIYSTDKKKSKSTTDLQDMSRTPLKDITVHYQSRLKRTLLVRAIYSL
jgi:hypothetical protein